MTEYAFVLGSNWLLSIAELLVYLQDRGLTVSLVNHSRHAAIVDIKEKMNMDQIVDMQSALGGCFKTSEVIWSYPLDTIRQAFPLSGRPNRASFADASLVPWTKRIWNKLRGKKIRFGMSSYPIMDEKMGGINYRRFTQVMNDAVKKKLLDSGARKVDYITYHKPDKRVSGRLNVALWPKIIASNNLLTPPNAEILAIFTETRVYFAKTLLVYDSVLQQYRDESRPFVSAEISTSPKICRTLLNLSGARPGEKVLDPFCGTGTLLMEGALLGMKVIGVDIDGNQVQGAKSNLKWLGQDLQQRLDFSVFKGDSRELSKIIKTTVDAVAFEPHLGPIHTEKPERKEAEKIATELTQLYNEVLIEITKILRPNGRIAMTLPVVNTDKGQVTIDVTKMIHGTGLAVYKLIPSEMIRKNQAIDDRLTIRPERQQIPERKRGQRVQRSIIVLEK